MAPRFSRYVRRYGRRDPYRRRDHAYPSRGPSFKQPPKNSRNVRNDNRQRASPRRDFTSTTQNHRIHAEVYNHTGLKFGALGEMFYEGDQHPQYTSLHGFDTREIDQLYLVDSRPCRGCKVKDADHKQFDCPVAPICKACSYGHKISECPIKFVRVRAYETFGEGEPLPGVLKPKTFRALQQRRNYRAAPPTEAAVKTEGSDGEGGHGARQHSERDTINSLRKELEDERRERRDDNFKYQAELNKWKLDWKGATDMVKEEMKRNGVKKVKLTLRR